MRTNSDPKSRGGVSPGKLCRVVITDSDLGNGDLEREELDGIAELTVGDCKTEEQIIQIARGADGLLVQHAPITRKVIESLERCRRIARYGIGFDTIDVEAATERGIFVMNVPDYCIDEVSDHACALILSCLRKVVLLDKQVRRGTWNIRAAMPIKRIRGMTLGLVGFGNTGRRVAEKLRGFGMNLIAYDPIVPPSAMNELSRQTGLPGPPWMSLPRSPSTQTTRCWILITLSLHPMRLTSPMSLLCSFSEGRLVLWLRY